MTVYKLVFIICKRKGWIQNIVLVSQIWVQNMKSENLGGWGKYLHSTFYE